MHFSVVAYPQPKIMKTPGRSLSRSSLLVRARQRGIKPEKENKTFKYNHQHLPAKHKSFDFWGISFIQQV